MASIARIQRTHKVFMACATFVLGTHYSLPAQIHGQVDTVSGPTLSVGISSPDYNAVTFKIDEDHLQKGEPLTWESGSPLFDLGTNAYGKQGPGVATCTQATYAADKDRVVIFHFVHWTVPANAAAQPQLQTSIWYVYRQPRFGKANVLIPSGTTGSGDPLIYGAKDLVILNVDIPSAATTLQSTITAPVAQGTSDLSTDITALFSALTNISKGGAAAMAAVVPVPKLSVFVAVTCEEGTTKLPFSVKIADAASAIPVGGGAAAAALAAGGGKGEKPDSISNGTTSTNASGSVSCTGTGNTLPCTMGRTFTSKEHAYVDVSAGLALPGVRETSYSFSSSNTSSGVSSSVKRHTDAYAFIDVFPFGALLPKESPVPHINFGVPVTSQSLHRPYIGLAENLTGWTHLQKSLSLPIAINVFGGIVFMKTEQLSGVPTTQAAFNSDLSWHWVHKYMIGIEVPISSVASKLSKSSSGGGSKSNSSKGS